MAEERTVATASPGETQALAERLGGILAAGDVVSLAGGLGAGKTCFVQGLARGLGVPAGTRVTSPTFNIVLEYAGRLPLYHVDLYRLADEDELVEIGVEHYLYGAGVTAVEWLDRFPGVAPAERLAVAIAFGAGPDHRTLVVTGHGARGAALAAAWLEAG